MSDNIHAHHRKRVRKEFLKNGINENTPKHKILEHLLFYSIPRVDTNEIAHNLINHFGSFSAVFDASPEELMKVDGVGENTAALIKLMIPIARFYTDDKTMGSKSFDSRKAICDYIIGKYFGITEERISLLMLSSNGKVLGFEMIGEGDVGSVTVSNRTIIEKILKYNATAVVLAHNHPNGVAVPSSEDLNVTRELMRSLKGIDVLLLDHIIVDSNDCISMYQSSQYRYLFE